MTLEVTTDDKKLGMLIDGEDIHVLEAAFHKFNEASNKLESKYELLLQETQDLREQLKQKDIEIKRAERLSTLGKTAAALAHDLRNPLGAIKLFVSLLKQSTDYVKVEKQGEVGELLGHIDNSIDIIDGVITNILQFAREQKITSIPLSIEAIIKEQISTMQMQMKKKVEVNIDFAGDSFIRGDENGLRRVFYNLIQNAYQAVKENGMITVSTKNKDKKLEVIIRDNGEGIRDEIIDTIFDPFVTNKNSGTGLGLSVVKQVVTQHQGSVVAYNDNGAVFKIELPIGRGDVK